MAGERTLVSLLEPPAGVRRAHYLTRSGWDARLVRRQLTAWVAALVVLVGCGGNTPHLGTGSEAPKASGCPPIPAELTSVAPLSSTATSDGQQPSPGAVAALQADVITVEQYGSEHPSEWGGVELSDNETKVVVAFTANVARHRADLDRLVAHRAALKVIKSSHTQQELDTIIAEIRAVGLSPGGSSQFESFGEGFGVVDVDFVPGREDLAAAYTRRFGDAVAITVGSRRYVADGCKPQPTPLRCPKIAGDDPESAGLSVRITLGSPTISRYGTATGRLVVRNVGTTTFLMDTGQPLVAHLTVSGTTMVVGAVVGAVAGTGRVLRLAPGQEGTMQVIIGTARCGGGPGTVVPPGRYGLRVVLRPEANPSTPAYLSSEAAVTISDAPPPVVPDPPVLPPVPVTAPALVS